MNQKNRQLIIVSQKLLWPTLILLAGLFSAFIVIMWEQVNLMTITPCIPVMVGTIGGLIGTQRRLKELSADDLDLLAGSWGFTLLGPIVGGILAFLLYNLFLSGLLSGSLFPYFVLDSKVTEETKESFKIIFHTHGLDFSDYAKLVFWSFLAGYSERFVTNIIGKFEADAISTTPQTTQNQNVIPTEVVDTKAQKE